MKLHESIDERLREFVLAQPMFFVGTAPAALDQHINVSPRGGAGSFVVLDEHTVAFADFTGSGSETVAHLRDNGRIVVMFCAFTGPPNIVRLHGKGEVVLPENGEWDGLQSRFQVDAPQAAVRAIIRIAVDRVSDSCGFSVPLLDYVGQRPLLDNWAERKGPDGLVAYRAEKNATSIDGLPAFGPA